MNSTVGNIFTNILICENIFQYFNIKQQLQLTSVCTQFEEIINLIWKSKCKKLTLYKGSDKEQDVVVSQQFADVNQYCCNTKLIYTKSDAEYVKYLEILDISDNAIRNTLIILNNEEAKKFLHLNCENVEKLQINFIDFVLHENFQNLKSLNCYGLLLNETNLMAIEKSCPALETLIARRCRTNGLQDIREENKSVEIIGRMTNLKNLVVQNDSCKLSYMRLEKILKILELQQLILELNIREEDAMDMPFQISRYSKNFNSLKVLRIGSFDESELQTFSSSFFNLYNVENLKELTICGSCGVIEIPQDFLEVLKKCCKNLNDLSFTWCEFNHFIPLTTLKKLTLQECYLKWSNLKVILSEMNLHSFTSVSTHYSMNFEYFEMTTSLQYLRIEAENSFFSFNYNNENNYSVDLKKLLIYNEHNVQNLKTFIWHRTEDSWICSEDEDLLHFPLKSQYQNLQILHIDLNLVAIEDLFGMKYLTKLVVIIPDNLNFSRFWKIIQHPALEYLTILSSYEDAWPSNPVIKPLNDAVIYNTNLIFINVPMAIFKLNPNVWLELLEKNVKLYLCCHYYPDVDIFDGKFLNKLICSDKFPQRIKSINICGLIIDLKQFLNDDEEYIAMVETAVTYLWDYIEHAMYIIF